MLPTETFWVKVAVAIPRGTTPSAAVGSRFAISYYGFTRPGRLWSAGSLHFWHAAAGVPLASWRKQNRCWRRADHPAEPLHEAMVLYSQWYERRFGALRPGC